MASRVFYPVATIGTEVKYISGSFATNGGSNPVTITGKGFTVVHTGTGLYTITLLDKYDSLQSFTHSLGLGAPAAQMTLAGATDVVVAQTLVLYTVSSSAGTVVDIAAAAGNVVNFALTLKNNKLP